MGALLGMVGVREGAVTQDIYRPAANATLAPYHKYVYADGAASADITLTLCHPSLIPGGLVFIRANTIGAGSNDILIKSPDSATDVDLKMTAVGDYALLASDGVHWYTLVEKTT